MAIARGTARLLLDEHRQRPFGGSVLELGRMIIYCTVRDFRRWAAEQGASLRDVEKPQLSHLPFVAWHGCMDDKTFFSLLGFDEVLSLDISNYENAEILHDLNYPVPVELHGRFDAIVESGTIQHVFHLPNVLKNIHDMLKPGGRIVHGMSPSHNHVDHGFYMYSPTLFHDFYTANGYRIERESFFQFQPSWYRRRLVTPPWRIYDYTPGCLDSRSYGGFGGEQLSIFVVATKLEGATGDRIPQQSAFGRIWPDVPDRPPEATVIGAEGGQLEASTNGDGVGSGLLHSLLTHPLYYRNFVRLKRFKRWLLRSERARLPPVSARY